jgi:hypothetical protein
MMFAMNSDKSKSSFTEVLGNSLRSNAPQSFNNKIKGIGSTDTAIRNCRVVALVDDKHFDAMAHGQQKQTLEISNFHNQYMLEDAPPMLEDTKSRVGKNYDQENFVVVTREVSNPNDVHYAMTAKR